MHVFTQINPSLLVCGLNPSVTIQMKNIEQYFPTVLFIMLHNVALTLKSFKKIVQCDHSNERSWAVLYRYCFFYKTFQIEIWESVRPSFEEQ